MANVFSFSLIGTVAAVTAESSEMSGWMVGVLIFAGAVLLLLETVLPGLVAGVLGVFCLFAGVVAGYSVFGLKMGNAILLGVAVGLMVGALIWVKYFPGSRMAKAFVSQKIVGDLGVEKPELLHQTGVAQSDLRPSGVAMLSGSRTDVVAEGAMITRGTPIKVVAVEGSRVVVRAA